MAPLHGSFLALALAAAPLATLCAADAVAAADSPAADAMPSAAVTGCEITSNIGIAVDGSGSIGPTDFMLIQQSVSNFISTTSGTAGGGTANSNVYYINAFDGAVYATSPAATNAGGAQATFVEQLPYSGGMTDIAAALADQLAQLTPLAPATVVLVTDGGSDFAAFEAQAMALAAADLTLACVGIGGADLVTLEALCAKAADGTPLVFSSDDIGDVALVLTDALDNIDSDGDGVPDCQDECPNDATKTVAPCDDGMAPPPRAVPPPPGGMYGYGDEGGAMYGDDGFLGMYGF